MIEAATACRLAGDVPGAFAAANVDLAIDLAAVGADHGRAVAAQVEEDLRHLAPDLLRWHVPRYPGQRAALYPDTAAVLRRYGREVGPALFFRTLPASENVPVNRERFQVLLGMSWRDNPSRFELDRSQWDVRYADGLRTLCGGDADRIPFFRPDGTPLAATELPAGPRSADRVAEVEWLVLLWDQGRYDEALRLVGIEYTGSAEHRPRDATTVAVERLAAACRAHCSVVPADTAPIPAGLPHGFLELRPSPAGAVTARFRDGNPPRSNELPSLRWRRPIDFDLVRFGLLTPDELHPLVRRAFFPSRAAEPAAALSSPRMLPVVRVWCRDSWHALSFERGVLRSVHSADEERRERVTHASGGKLTGCFRAIDGWRGGSRWLPKQLRQLRQELFDRAYYGDTPGVLAMLDAGLDPSARIEGGRTLLHFLLNLDHRALLPRLLTAGLRADVRDHDGMTPLDAARYGGADPALIDALTAAQTAPPGRAGASPTNEG
jgi:hypothetical protein